MTCLFSAPRARVALALVLCAGCSASRPDAAPRGVTTTDQPSGTGALLIAVAPVSDRVAWASGAQGTWLRTTDGGATWQTGRVPGADTLQFRDVHAVDADTAYLLSIGTGEQSRIYRTRDGGATWTLQHTNPDAAGFLDCMGFWDARRGLVVGDAVDGRIVILATEDGGESWRRVSAAALPPARPGEGSFAASGTCLTTGANGRAWIVMSNPEEARTLRTDDHGRTWTAHDLPITTRTGVGPMSVAFRDDLHGLVLGGGYEAEAGDLLAAATSDGGRTWTPRARPPLRAGVWGAAYVPGAARPAVVAVSPSGMVWSPDEGRSWVVLDTANYWSVGFASARAGWAVGAGGRITRISGF